MVARDCPSKQLLMLESWVSPLLYMLADAAATKDSKLAHCAVDLMGACVDSGINSVSCRKIVKIGTVFFQYFGGAGNAKTF